MIIKDKDEKLTEQFEEILSRQDTISDIVSAVAASTKPKKGEILSTKEAEKFDFGKKKDEAQDKNEEKLRKKMNYYQGDVPLKSNVLLGPMS